VVFNPAAAESLFAGSDHTFAEIAALGKDRKPLPHFALATSLKANATVLAKKWNRRIWWASFRVRIPH